MAARIEIYPTVTGLTHDHKIRKKYRWRLRAGNGQTVATGHQAFANKANAKRAAVNVVVLARVDLPLVLDEQTVVDIEKSK